MNDTKDLTSLRENWIAPDPPSPAAHAAARTALTRQFARAAAPARTRSRRPRLGWLVGSAALTGALAVAVAVVATVGSTPPASPVHADGQQILLAAADVAQTRPAKTGKYWHVTEVVPNEMLGRPQQLDSWTARDGKTYTMPEGYDGVLLMGLDSGFPVGASWLTLDQLQDLPTDPEALRAWIADSFANATNPVAPPAPGDTSAPAPVPADGGRLDIPAEAMPGTIAGALEKLLWDVPVPPAVRAAALRALASMPNVASLGTVDGGEALRISFPPPPADKFPGGKLPAGADHMTLVIDPATSMLVSTTNYQGTFRILGAEWTDEMPKVISS